jgi:hypothetical protein
MPLKTPIPDPTDPVVQAALLPFVITERLGVPCGYERSFKLAGGNILSNRYLLGINTVDVPASQLLAAGQEMGMPPLLYEQFQAGLADANLVFLGFEADAEGGALYKIYLEYWDQLQKKLRQNMSTKTPELLHRGFKWQYNRPQSNVITEYHCLPGLTTADIRRHISTHYDTLPQAKCLHPVNQIIDLAESRTVAQRFIYVEVSEAGNNRHSFDLNLYPTGLTVNEISKPLAEAVDKLDVEPRKFDHLMTIVGDKLLGHISAGCGRDGNEYLTIYFEN